MALDHLLLPQAAPSADMTQMAVNPQNYYTLHLLSKDMRAGPQDIVKGGGGGGGMGISDYMSNLDAKSAQDEQTRNQLQMQAQALYHAKFGNEQSDPAQARQYLAQQDMLMAERSGDPRQVMKALALHDPQHYADLMNAHADLSDKILGQGQKLEDLSAAKQVHAVKSAQSLGTLFYANASLPPEQQKAHWDQVIKPAAEALGIPDIGEFSQNKVHAGLGIAQQTMNMGGWNEKSGTLNMPTPVSSQLAGGSDKAPVGSTTPGQTIAPPQGYRHTDITNALSPLERDPNLPMDPAQANSLNAAVQGREAIQAMKKFVQDNQFIPAEPDVSVDKKTGVPYMAFKSPADQQWYTLKQQAATALENVKGQGKPPTQQMIQDTADHALPKFGTVDKVAFQQLDQLDQTLRQTGKGISGVDPLTSAERGQQQQGMVQQPIAPTQQGNAPIAPAANMQRAVVPPAPAVQPTSAMQPPATDPNLAPHEAANPDYHAMVSRGAPSQADIAQAMATGQFQSPDQAAAALNNMIAQTNQIQGQAAPTVNPQLTSAPVTPQMAAMAQMQAGPTGNDASGGGGF